MNTNPTDYRKFRGALAVVPGIETCPFRRLIGAWLSDCKANDLSPKTISDYRDKVFKFYWWWTDYTHNDEKCGTHPKNVTTQHIKQFVVYLREPVAFRWGIRDRANNRSGEILSPVSVAAYGRTVKVFFGWLEEEGHISETPFNRSVKLYSRTRADNVVKTVNEPDLIKLFTALTDPARVSQFWGLRDLAIISLLLDSGIRRGELLSIRKCDMDLGEYRVVVRGKTGQRWAVFGEQAYRAIYNYLQHPVCQDLEGAAPLWVTEEGEPLTYEGFNGVVRRLERDSGVDFHAHSLRHTFATMLAAQGIDAFTLRSLLGHASVETTKIYVSLNVETLQEAHRTRSPLSKLAIGGKAIISRKGRPRKANKRE